MPLAKFCHRGCKVSEELDTKGVEFGYCDVASAISGFRRDQMSVKQRVHRVLPEIWIGLGLRRGRGSGAIVRCVDDQSMLRR